ncbi:MAG: flavodoxin family protein [Erysipelotrichaceae bacterium]|nr:flavodoxin family protein [Erysipelotrichaceae bacterium]
MNLLIHDLDETGFNKIAGQYKDWTIISDHGTIRPCVGCFSCWNSNPGQCVMKDGYENMGYLIHHADEVVVISRYTYGGFSSFVKNVFDRSLGYVLPHFEIVNGESHHKKRYDEDKSYNFIFYGKDLSEEDKESARRYVTAVATNMRTHVSNIIFTEAAEDINIKTKDTFCDSGKTVLFNASMRNVKGNSAILARQLQKQLNGDVPIIDLSGYLNRMDELMKEFEDVETIVLCTPLYVDGLPSQLIRFMEKYEREYTGGRKKIYVLANMGLFESRQLVNLMSAVRQWSDKMRFEYNGGLAVSAGEMIGPLTEAMPFGKWVTKEVAEGTNRLAGAINRSEKIEDIYTDAYRFPRWLYIAIANSGWKRMAKAAGIDPKELFRRL